MKKIFLMLLLLGSYQFSFAQININTATINELVILKGIGPEKAQAIIDYREENGNFEKVEDIVKVKGIGEKTLQKLKEDLTVTGETDTTKVINRSKQ